MSEQFEADSRIVDIVQRIYTRKECLEHDQDPASTLALVEDLRRMMNPLISPEGYVSLLTRALTLAKRDVPSLQGVEVNRAGTLNDFVEEGDGGMALVSRLIGLMFAFIGERLTLHLLEDLWPNVSRGEQHSEDTDE